MEKKEQVKKILENKNIIIEEQTITERLDRWDVHEGQMLPNCARELAAEIDALYSDSPSPEMVCPKCNGTGLTPFQRGMNDTPACIENRDCPECFGTGKVPSPEPPEKVREEIAELEKAIQELLGIVNESEGIIGWHLNGDILKWEQCESIQVISEKIPILLKLQQAGWGDLKEAQAEIKRLNDALTIKELGIGEMMSEYSAVHKHYEAKIKELEEKQCLGAMNCAGISGMPAIDVIKDAKAEARQQALKEVGEYRCTECETPNFIHVVIPLKIWNEWGMKQ